MNDKEKLEAIKEIVNELYISVMGYRCAGEAEDYTAEELESPVYAKIERLWKILES